MQWENEDDYSERQSDEDFEDQVVEEEYEESSYEPNEEEFYDESDSEERSVDEERLLGTALVRLDQARLYEMLINHDLFEGVEANDVSLKAVKRELKQFIMGRLENLLGLGKGGVSSVNQSPFSELEVQTLKDLAFAASKGATRAPKAVQKRETPKPLTPRSVSKPATPNIPQRMVQKPVSRQTARPEPRPAQKPQQKRASNKDIPSITKPVHEMSEEERIEHVKKTSKVYQNRVARSQSALPMPTVDQQIMQYSSILSDGRNAASAIARGIGALGIQDVGDGD